MKTQINDLLLKMQTGENCIGETANHLLNLFGVVKSLKDKEVPNFDEWLKNFKKTGEVYWLNKEVLYCKEAMKLHYDNLPNK